MKTIVQLSDLHFGKVEPSIVDSLTDVVRTARPDLLIVSGDLTQRATHEQFNEAKEFLARFDTPKIIVPGNHDVPLFDLWKRFSRPYERFTNIVDPTIEPFHLDDEMAVMGVNTSRSFAWKEGRMNFRQLDLVRERMTVLDRRLVKILVTHHPPERLRTVPGTLAARSPQALHTLMRSRIDLFMSGHLHRTASATATHRLRDGHHSAILVQAGTATSVRYRNEPNSFNVLRVASDRINIEPHAWSEERRRFEEGPRSCFNRTEKGWLEC